MRWFIFLLLVSPALAAQSRAVIFVDTSQPVQARLISDINRMLYFSATLRNEVKVQVFDINEKSAGFSGIINYSRDASGKAISKYRPQELPYLICLNEKTEKLRVALENKEQLCLCLKQC
ncbi:hypothetical protein H1684_000239 [Escherichia coli]|uniref:hypothetical protein n=2 Tax=Escherichia coli TaxID=562 RepID=UPI0016A92831|nr:hypothetical protein [Escherichia coli]EEQ1544204.1 hypothetical protein [Escherichia coli]EER0126116.1 hypothetical protein [Escherichia coli]EER9791895.1 hypothetical protein [Escherichia coli]EES0862428.1 hypothetical protein [Escherichia coli]EES3123516.1 hypothetical protein [Escherichia coli]